MKAMDIVLSVNYWGWITSLHSCNKNKEWFYVSRAIGTMLLSIPIKNMPCPDWAISGEFLPQSPLQLSIAIQSRRWVRNSSLLQTYCILNLFFLLHGSTPMITTTASISQCLELSGITWQLIVKLWLRMSDFSVSEESSCCSSARWSSPWSS